MKKTFQILASAAALLTASCQHLADIGPVDIDKEGKENEAPKNYAVIDITDANLKKHNRSHKSTGYSTPGTNLSKTYTDRVTYKDKLSLFVMDNRQAGMINGSLTLGPFEVDSNSTISVPHIGSISTANKSIRDIEKEIQEKYTAISESAHVSLNRVERQFYRANIVGLVKNPGQQPIDRKGMTLTDLVGRSGGTTVEPYLCQYNLHRDGKTFKLSNGQINKKKLVIQDGDLLEITRSREHFVSVFGTAGRQANQAFPSDHTHLTDILAESGGLNGRSSNAKGVFILRLNSAGGKHKIYRFNLKTGNGLIAARQFHIQGRDIVYVTEAPLSRWNRALRDFLSLSEVSSVANLSRMGN